MKMVSFLKDLVLGDLPHEQLVIVVKTLIVVFIVHFAYVGGVIPGFAGFANARDFEEVENWMLRENIVKSQERLCKAAVQNNADAKRYAAERLYENVHQWQRKNDEIFNIPTCDELGIETPVILGGMAWWN